MSSKGDADKFKLIQDKCQLILGSLLREEDNKYCVDCDAKGPRWASWNLGVFLCIRCAGIHRNLGVHISKVKSVNLDTWTPEQIACLQQMGNSQARAVYEANLPENFRRPQTDSSLEAFVRAKYEQKKYIAKEWVPPPPPAPAFNIDEEKKRERERKKKPSKVTNVFEISPLPQHHTAVPRPHSTGPHSPAIQPDLSMQIQQVPDSSDLLSLGGGDIMAGRGDTMGGRGDTNNTTTDIFDAFLSAPISTAADKAPMPATSTREMPVSKSNVTNEEMDFFNQKAVSDANKANKMTKESILSLYGSSTVQIPNVQSPSPRMTPLYNVSGGMYLSQQGFAQVGMPGYQSVSTQGINPCNTGSNVPAVYTPFATSIRPDARNQPNWWYSVSPGGRDQSVLMADSMRQVTQQMANLQVAGHQWNRGVSAGPVNAPGMVINSNQTAPGVVWPPNSQNQNFWQQ